MTWCCIEKAADGTFTAAAASRMSFGYTTRARVLVVCVEMIDKAFEEMRLDRARAVEELNAELGEANAKEASA